MEQNQEIKLDDGVEYVELCDLLKHAGLADSGGAAKHAIAAGGVTVDGVAETRKRRKVRAGQVVETDGQRVTVVGSSEPLNQTEDTP